MNFIDLSEEAVNIIIEYKKLFPKVFTYLENYYKQYQNFLIDKDQV